MKQLLRSEKLMVTVDLVQAALMFVLTNGRWLNFMLSWGEWLAIVDLLATHVYVRSAVYEFNAHMLNEILVTEEVVPKKIGVLLHDIALEKRDEWPVHGVYAKV